MKPTAKNNNTECLAMLNLYLLPHVSNGTRQRKQRKAKMLYFNFTQFYLA